MLMTMLGMGGTPKPLAVGAGSRAEGCREHGCERPEASGGRRQAGAQLGRKCQAQRVAWRGAPGRGPRGGGRRTHVAGGGSGGRWGCLGDGAQLFLREALGLIEGGARVEHRVLDEDAHGAKHEGQEQVHVDVVACAMQPPAGRATAPWWVGGQEARPCAAGMDTPHR